MRFQFLAAFGAKMAVSRDMKPCCMVQEYQCFEETCFLRLQGILLCKKKICWQNEQNLRQNPYYRCRIRTRSLQ